MVVNGRYPNGIKFDRNNIQKSLKIDEDGNILIRLDDSDHLDFWLEILATIGEIEDG